MRFDAYRRQVLAVGEPVGLADAVRARLAAAEPAPGALLASEVGAGRCRRGLRWRRWATVGIAALLALALAIPGLQGALGGVFPLRPATAEALVVDGSRLVIDPNVAISLSARPRSVTLMVCVEFRCANGEGTPCEARVEGEGLALAEWGRGGQPEPASSLSFEGGRSVKARLVITAPVDEATWRAIGSAGSPAEREEAWRAVLPVLGEGRLVLSRPGAPDAVYAFDVASASEDDEVMGALVGGVRASLPLRRAG